MDTGRRGAVRVGSLPGREAPALLPRLAPQAQADLVVDVPQATAVEVAACAEVCGLRAAGLARGAEGRAEAALAAAEGWCEGDVDGEWVGRGGGGGREGAEVAERDGGGRVDGVERGGDGEGWVRGRRVRVDRAAAGEVDEG